MSTLDTNYFDHGSLSTTKVHTVFSIHEDFSSQPVSCSSSAPVLGKMTKTKSDDRRPDPISYEGPVSTKSVINLYDTFIRSTQKPHLSRTYSSKNLVYT